MDGQDWEPVVFSKNKPKPAENNINNNFNKLVDDELPEKKKQTEKKEQQSMMQTRISCGYKSQKDLATATNGKISVARINQIESGRGNPPTGFEKTILFKLLKIKFKN